MKISVAICTWNRARLLAEALQSMSRLDLPPGLAWELIVVDNNSTDETRRVLDRHARTLPLVRLFEPRPGKSYAANRAAAEATGDLLVWTDDDVRVGPGWLRAYVDAASRWPDAAFFAGPIDPLFEVRPPAWIGRHLQRLKGVYVMVDHGPEPHQLGPGEAVFGANMAFRTDVARAFPLNEALGRIRGQLLGADDTELVRRVTASGRYGVWVPGARLEHFSPEGRLTKRYVSGWFRDAGRSLVAQGQIAGGRRVAGVPLWLLRKYWTRRAARFLWAPLSASRWFSAFRESLILDGAARACREARSRARAGARTDSAFPAGTP